MGQSGNLLSSHYEDHAEHCRDCRHVPMPTDRVAVEEDALGTLVLTPKQGVPIPRRRTVNGRPWRGRLLAEFDDPDGLGCIGEALV